MFDRTKSCCFTGHRRLPPLDVMEIQKSVQKEIIRLYKSGVTHFIAGGALGFDTLAAITVLNLSLTHPEIKLTLALPCKDYRSKWLNKDFELTERIISRAYKTVFVSEKYSRECMHKRNRYMVDHSDYCIGYASGKISGTAATIRYAKQKGLKIINIYNKP